MEYIWKDPNQQSIELGLIVEWNNKNYWLQIVIQVLWGKKNVTLQTLGKTFLNENDFFLHFFEESMNRTIKYVLF